MRRAWLGYSQARRDQIIEALLAGEADFVVCSPPIDEPNIATRILFKESAYMMLPAKHPLKNKKSLCLKDLDQKQNPSTADGFYRGLLFLTQMQTMLAMAIENQGALLHGETVFLL